MRRPSTGSELVSLWLAGYDSMKFGAWVGSLHRMLLWPLDYKEGFVTLGFRCYPLAWNSLRGCAYPNRAAQRRRL